MVHVSLLYFAALVRETSQYFNYGPVVNHPVYVGIVVVELGNFNISPNFTQFLKVACEHEVKVYGPYRGAGCNLKPYAPFMQAVKRSCLECPFSSASLKKNPFHSFILFLCCSKSFFSPYNVP